jgi:hypothetical protein
MALQKAFAALLTGGGIIIEKKQKIFSKSY